MGFGSRPVWGAWIEIVSLVPAYGDVTCRAPYGARGLKCRGFAIWSQVLKSRPVWGAWIEINTE